MMKTWIRISFLVVLAAACGSAEEPRLDAEADRIMKAMSDRMDGEQKAAFTAEISYDEVEGEPGEEYKLQYGGSVTGSVRRPDRMRFAVRGDKIDRDLFYDGKSFSIFAPAENVYAQREITGGISEALDRIDEIAGWTPPLAEFFHTGTYAALKPKLVRSRYLGLHTVGDRRCHHLFFEQDEVNWQIWVDAEQNVPRKLVITYKSEPTHPQFTAIFRKWDLKPDLPDGHFTFNPPADAIRAEMVATR